MVKPFAALRPKPELAAQICELPYDVMSSDEARAIAAGNPLSFLHVSKPEIDLPPGTDVHAPEVYARGGENFQKLIRDGALRPDAQPCFYLYRQIMGAHTQTGLVAAASCEEYQRGIIKKHEQTRVDKEDDRVRHIETLNAQTSPVFLTYPAARTWTNSLRKKSPANRRLILPPGTVCGTCPGRFRTRTMSNSSNAICADSRPVHCRRPPSQRGGGAGFSIAQGRGAERTISGRDFSAQPDADSALQPRAEGFERLDAGAVVGNSRHGLRHRCLRHGRAGART